MIEAENQELSLGGNIWNIADTDERETERMCRQLGLSPNLSKLLLLPCCYEELTQPLLRIF